MQYSRLGNFIKKKREDKKLSLNKFANLSDVDPAIISRLENLKQGIKLEVLLKIAEACGQTPAQFLTEFENEININKCNE